MSEKEPVNYAPLNDECRKAFQIATHRAKGRKQPVIDLWAILCGLLDFPSKIRNLLDDGKIDTAALLSQLRATHPVSAEGATGKVLPTDDVNEAVAGLVSRKPFSVHTGDLLLALMTAPKCEASPLFDVFRRYGVTVELVRRLVDTDRAEELKSELRAAIVRWSTGGYADTVSSPLMTFSPQAHKDAELMADACTTAINDMFRLDAFRQEAIRLIDAAYRQDTPNALIEACQTIRDKAVKLGEIDGETKEVAAT